MKVKLLRNPADSLGCRIAEGEMADIDDPIGTRLVSLGIAIEIEQPKPEPKSVPVVRAIPEPPAIAEATAPQIAPVEAAVEDVKQYKQKQGKPKPVVQVQHRKHKES